MWGNGMDRAGSGQGQVVGTCECGNEPSGFIKFGEFLDQLETGQLRKEDSAQWSKYVVDLHAKKNTPRFKMVTSNRCKAYTREKNMCKCWVLREGIELLPLQAPVGRLITL